MKTTRGLRFFTLALLTVLLGRGASVFDRPAGTPMEVTVCLDSVQTEAKDIDAQLEALKAIGVTSIQTYIYWNKVEKSPGVYDWSGYDREVSLFKRHGLKWVPFVIAGPWYVTPEFVRQDPQLAMLRCLEHDRDSRIPSIWSEHLKVLVRAYLAEFAAHYRPMGVLESVNIGITGDYGEAIYSVIGNWPGEYHSHGGYWCGDPGAVASFRARMQGLYPKGIGELNRAWRSHHSSFAQLQPFLPTAAPSEHAWQDMLGWYRSSMTDFADFWLRTTRELFPDEEIYLCTGGDMAPEHGSDFSAQAKVAARYGAGVRITNEASSYPSNVRLTRMVGSAGLHYGAYFGHEPASTVTATGMLGRTFNALASGARQLFTYSSPELMQGGDARYRPGPGGAHIERYQKFLRTTVPIRDTAIYLPTPTLTETRSDREGFGDLLTGMRRFIDYDLIDDHMVADGALQGKSILIIMYAQVIAGDTMERIRKWVQSGGIVFFIGQRSLDWDGSSRSFDELVGLTEKGDEAIGITNLVVPKPQALPAVAALKSVIVTGGYVGVAPDCEKLMGSDYTERVFVAWRRELGSGQVFAYFGPMDLKAQESDWKGAKQVPLHFLSDCFRRCVREGFLREEPPTLTLGTPEVYKVQTTGGLLVLNMGDKPREIRIKDRPVVVPALSIVQP